MKSTLQRHAASVAEVGATEGSMAAAEEVARDLGKAAIKAMVDKSQKCVPAARVPEEIQLALQDSSKIPGSGSWMTCGTLNANMHTCGSSCCCNGGFNWNGDSQSCVKAGEGSASRQRVQAVIRVCGNKDKLRMSFSRRPQS